MTGASKPYHPGPVGAGVLAALAEADDGLTAAALTTTLGRSPEQRTMIDHAIRMLDRHGCVRVLTRIRAAGPAVAVWGLTTTGRTVLAQAEIPCKFCLHDYDSHNLDAADEQRNMPCTECPDGICCHP